MGAGFSPGDPRIGDWAALYVLRLRYVSYLTS
jgi:hypothetical protein